MNFSSQTNTDQFKKEFEEFLKEKYGAKDVEQDSLGQKSGPTGEYRPGEFNFDLKPEELEEYLNQFVECQEEAIEVIATKIATHYNRMKLEDTLTEEQKLVGNIKSNVLLIGPTGVGKTYIVKLIANKIGVPFVKGDATKFSETGYVGGDVEDLIRDLVREADGDIRSAEYGIIYLDEIDKIASSANTRGIDVSRTGVQRNLLKLMEESEVDLRVPHDMASQMEAAMEAQKTGKVARKKVNTKNILFVVSGAFSGMEEIIRNRVNQKKMGFGAEHTSSNQISKSELLKKVKTEDLIEYGFESEFVGRLPVITVLNELSVDALFNILKNKNSSVTLSKKRDFEAYGIAIEFDDDALRIFAERAHVHRTGARGLVNIIENVLIKFEKKLPSTKIKKLKVTKEIVENPELELNKLLTYSSMKEFQEEFLTQHGIVFEFSDQAINKISRKAGAEKSTFKQVAKFLFKDYEYGLKLAGKTNFIVSDEVIEDPKKYLDELIKKSYSSKN
ncbi:AAA domain-containing protein [bacterium]|nr:MAG: AAA domain-containing protein [bacterium]